MTRDKSAKKGRKSSKKKNQQRPARVKRTEVVINRRMGKRGSGLPEPIRRLIFSLQHPFDASACIPDGARGVSCFSVKQTGVLSTGVGGTVCGIALNPTDPRNLVFVDSGGTTTLAVITGNWSSASQIANISGFYGKVRPVSAGLRMVFIGNTNADAGVIVAGQHNGRATLSLYNGGTSSQFAASAEYYKMVPLRNGLEIMWRPNDMEDTGDFRDISAAVSPVSTIFVPPYLSAWVFGCAANSTAVQYEWIVNYEGQIYNQTFMSGGAELGVSSGPAAPGWFEHTMNAIGNYVPIQPILSGVSTAAGQGVQQYASQVITRGLGSMSNGMAALGVLSATQRHRLLS